MTRERTATPGPWRANKEGKRHSLVGDGMWFAKIAWTVTGPRNDADAALIAAAPEMLAALKRIADIAHHNHGRQDEKMADIEPIARAAVSRAESTALSGQT